MIGRQRLVSLLFALMMAVNATAAAASEEVVSSDDGDVLLTNATPAGQVAIFNSNVMQVYNDDEMRRSALGRRFYTLRTTFGEDGMGYSADIFLLQEVNTVQAEDLRIELQQKNGFYNTLAASSNNHILEDSTSLLHVSDTAIIYNNKTMALVPGSKGHIDHTYTRSEACSESTRLSLGIALDLDGDGKSDCEKPKWKRTFYAEFQEVASGLRFAVASVHWVLDDFFSDKTTAANKKAEWAEDLALHLRTTFPSSTAYAIAGDFNQKRCRATDVLATSTTTDDSTDVLAAPKEPVVCETNPFWTRFSALGFVDTIFAMHGQTDDRLTAQYRDGFVDRTSTPAYRKKRIDHIFTAGETVHSAASFDLSCGVGAPEPYDWNCKEITHPDAYSDHRIVWAFMGPVPRVERIE